MSASTSAHPHPTWRLLLGLAAATSLAGWTGCTQANENLHTGRWPLVITADHSGDCAQALALARQQAHPDGLASTFSLLNWNVEKAQNPGLVNQFSEFAQDTDLIFLQEAVPLRKTDTLIKESLVQAFVRGYVQDEIETGVLTLARVPHLVHCHLLSTEPWLRTPKATSVTLYPLADSDDTLLTVNLHAINFSFGVEAYAAQLDAAAALIRSHEGPVIFGGDLNTWSAGRQQTLDQLAAELQLTPLPFLPDYRTARFGRALDHLYVRGLYSETSKTQKVTTSDHNPLFAILRRAQP